MRGPSYSYIIHQTQRNQSIWPILQTVDRLHQRYSRQETGIKRAQKKKNMRKMISLCNRSELNEVNQIDGIFCQTDFSSLHYVPTSQMPNILTLVQQEMQLRILQEKEEWTILSGFNFIVILCLFDFGTCYSKYRKKPSKCSAGVTTGAHPIIRK